MAYTGNVRPKGSVRITVGNIIFAGSNSGLFVDPIVNNGVGDNSISIDPDNPNALQPSDTVQVALEGIGAAASSVERVDSNTLRIRTFNAAGAALNVGYSLLVNSVFRG